MFCAAWTATGLVAGGPGVRVAGAAYGAPVAPPTPVPPGSGSRRRWPGGHAAPIYDLWGFLVGVVLRRRRA